VIDDPLGERLNDSWDAMLRDDRGTSSAEETAAIAAVLRLDGPVDPDPAFIAALRERLLSPAPAGTGAAAHAVGIVQPFGPNRRALPRRSMVVAVAVAAALLIFLLASAAGPFGIAGTPGMATVHAATTTPTPMATRTVILLATTAPAGDGS